MFNRFNPHHVVDVITVILSVLLCSCSGSKSRADGSEPDYPSITDTVRLNRLSVSDEFLKPTRLFVAQNHLVVAHTGMDHVFNAYSLPLTGDVVTGVTSGRGPKELIAPDMGSVIDGKDGFRIVDSDFRIKKIAITDEAVSVVSDAMLFMNDAKVIVQNGMTYSGGYYIFPNMSDLSEGHKQYVRVDKEGNKSLIGDYPEWGKSRGENEPFLEFINYANARIGHPGGKKFAEFYARYRRMRILDNDGNVLSEAQVNYPTPADMHAQGLTYRTYAGYPETDGKYISMALENRDVSRLDSPAPDYSEVQIWNWDGELLKRLILVPRMSFTTVDFKKGMIFGIDSNEESSLFYADISDCL
ncbi:MAG: hypothetical protein K6F06_01115 [Bacteroidales bacterium]|nr:hypothetical protein [Bacteroidales bacterium]